VCLQRRGTPTPSAECDEATRRWRTTPNPTLITTSLCHPSVNPPILRPLSYIPRLESAAASPRTPTSSRLAPLSSDGVPQEDFQAAAAEIKPVHGVSWEEMLEMYGLYKQATIGDNNTCGCLPRGCCLMPKGFKGCCCPPDIEHASQFAQRRRCPCH
jgi:hypothetical protein